MKSLLSQPITEQIYREAKAKTEALVIRGLQPHLAIIQVGEDPASTTYIELKSKRAKEIGILTSLYQIAENAPFEEVLKSVKFLATDDEVQGMIIQLPLPKCFSTAELELLLTEIPAEKDVDALRGLWLTHSKSELATTLPDLLSQQSLLLPPMVCGVVSLLDYYQIPFKDQRIVLVGEGRLVGRPLFEYFHKLELHVEKVNEDTNHIFSITREADILISGTGESDLITYQWVKKGGVTVINCAQDVHEDSVGQVAAALSPAKGGIGPLTVAWLLHNVVKAAERRMNE